ncbi:MAG: hypothetical protein XD69_0984 [Clostridia bacterium 62_21]|nr:MAG: hypothetical protein XD69_0984 [Clostridia bacterium 62_21]
MITIGGIVFALALYRLVLQPQYETYAAARERLGEVKQQVVAAEALARREAVEIEALAAARQRLAVLKPMFETNIENGSVLADIGLEAVRKGVAITAFKPGAVVNRTHYLELPLHFSVEGNYPSVQAFIRKLENLPNVSEIRRLDIRAGSFEGNAQEKTLPGLSNGYVQAQFLVVVYATPGQGRELELAELGEWLLGRFNPFLAPGSVSPLPGKVPASRTVVPGQSGREHLENERRGLPGEQPAANVQNGERNGPVLQPVLSGAERPHVPK